MLNKSENFSNHVAPYYILIYSRKCPPERTIPFCFLFKKTKLVWSTLFLENYEALMILIVLQVSIQGGRPTWP